MHRPRDVWADVADVPRLVRVAGPSAISLGVGQDEAETVSVTCHPAPLGALPEAGVQIALTAGAVQIDRQPGLVLAVAGSGTGGVGGRPTVGPDPVLVGVGLGLIGPVPTDHAEVCPLRFRGHEHAVELVGHLGAELVCRIAPTHEVRRGVVARGQRSLFGDDHQQVLAVVSLQVGAPAVVPARPRRRSTAR